jgi:hypothetical protein
MPIVAVDELVAWLAPDLGAQQTTAAVNTLTLRTLAQTKGADGWDRRVQALTGSGWCVQAATNETIRPLTGSPLQTLRQLLKVQGVCSVAIDELTHWASTPSKARSGWWDASQRAAGRQLEFGEITASRDGLAGVICALGLDPAPTSPDGLDLITAGASASYRACAVTVSNLILQLSDS